ncbi:MAG: FAD-dependent oxidoreductase [Ruminococcaceae bacterium]|nr:FAD-dependent oxidoreductase [Oscillospiraceae bacterium]
MSEKKYPSLDGDMKCDCAVIGGGLSGIFTAHLLSERGMDTVLLESGKIASGKTGRSTAKVTVVHSGAYSSISKKVSEEAARKYAAANLAGMRMFESFIDSIYGKNYGLRDMYLYSKYGSHRLAQEYNAMSMCGIECRTVHDTPLPFGVRSAVLIPNQRQIDPVDFSEKFCQRASFRIYENSPVTLVDHRTLYSCGHRIDARNIVIATNYPLSVPLFAAPVKLPRKTSCAVKMKGVGDSFPYVMAYGEDVEVGFRRDGDDSIIVSGMKDRGAGHKYTIEHLADEVREFAPDSEIESVWTNNDTYTHDGIPYVGEVYPGVYIACGYSAWGMTNSAGAAVILAEELTGGKMWYSDVFSPKRKSMKMMFDSSFTEHMSSAVAGNMKRMFREVKDNAEDVGEDEGMIITHGGQKCGVYRDSDGKRYYVSVKCPHLGCELEWNAVDKTWDCPCHGSRFSYTGECVSNPAVKGIRIEF